MPKAVNTETEIKLRLSDTIKVEDIEGALGVRFNNPILQTDYIYAESKDVILDLKEGATIYRFRKCGAETRFTAKTIITRIPLVRRELEFSTSEEPNFIELLAFLGIHQILIVEKQRYSAIFEKQTIEFDIVKGLGNFLEVEWLTSTIPTENIEESSAVKIAMEKLGLDAMSIVHMPYDTQLLRCTSSSF